MNGDKYPILFKYNGHYDTKSVEVIIDYYNWETGKIVLKEEYGDNVWTALCELPSGNYQYKFLIDSKIYKLDDNNNLTAKDINGNTNSLLLVGKAKLKGNILHYDYKDVDFYDNNIIYFKLAVNKDLYNCSNLILIIDDIQYIVHGFSFFTDEVYKYFLFKYKGNNIKKNFIYYFEIRTNDNGFVYYGKNGIVESEWEVESFCYEKKNDIFKTPEWVKKSIFYQIFPERFCNGNHNNNPPNVNNENELPSYNSFYGGDLDGVINNISYLKELGISAIYFNPIFSAPSNHKYDTRDYLKIDPYFGDEETFEKLHHKLEKNDIKFILDGVFNHTGTEFWAFQDIIKNQENSKYINWYIVKKFPLIEDKKVNYECWWNFPSLPKLNIENEEVKNYIINVAQEWLKKGSSGWRLDVPSEIPHKFWKEFRKVVKKTNPDAYIVGEIWNDGSAWLNGDEFDAVMNYRFRDACVEFFARRRIDGDYFVKEIGKQIYDYPMQANFAMLNLLSSHDTARFYSIANKNVTRVKLAVLFQFTYIGTPCIYYGEEIGMEGGKDPDNRRFMIWDKNKWNKELLDFYKKMIKIRKENIALTLGDFRFIFVRGNVIGYERFYDNDKLLIFINNSDNNIVIDVTKYFGNGDFIDISKDVPLKRKKVYTLYANDFVILKKLKERVEYEKKITNNYYWG